MKTVFFFTLLLSVGAHVEAKMIHLGTDSNCMRRLPKSPGVYSFTCHEQWRIERYCDTDTGDLLYVHITNGIHSATISRNGCTKWKGMQRSETPHP